MQLKAYSIYDNKALIYHAPFFTHTDGAAVRMFSDLANDPNTSVGRHPSDYSLWCIGIFDDQKASLTPVVPLLHVYDAVGLVKLTPSLPLEPEKVSLQNGSLLRPSQTEMG